MIVRCAVTLATPIVVVNCQFGAFEDENEPTMQTKMQKYFPMIEKASSHTTGLRSVARGSTLSKLSFGEIFGDDRCSTDANLRTTCRAISPTRTNFKPRTSVRIQLREKQLVDALFLSFSL